MKKNGEYETQKKSAEKELKAALENLNTHAKISWPNDNGAAVIKYLKCERDFRATRMLLTAAKKKFSFVR